MAFATPMMLNGTHGLGVAGTFGLIAVWLLMGLLFVLFFAPETKGLSLEELDQMFVAATGWADISRWRRYIPCTRRTRRIQPPE